MAFSLDYYFRNRSRLGLKVEVSGHGKEILHRYDSPPIQTTLQQPYEIIPRPQILEQDCFIKLRLGIKERRKGLYSELVNFKTRIRI